MRRKIGPVKNRAGPWRVSEGESHSVGLFALALFRPLRCSRKMQLGHRSFNSTMVYLHGDQKLASEEAQRIRMDIF
jgi:hypothetical protein